MMSKFARVAKTKHLILDFIENYVQYDIKENISNISKECGKNHIWSSAKKATWLSRLKCVGFMWSLFLTRYLYLGVKMELDQMLYIGPFI